MADRTALRVGLVVAWTSVVLLAVILFGGSVARFECPEIRTVGNNRTEAEHAELVAACQERHRAAADVIERSQPLPLVAAWAAGIGLIIIVTRPRPAVRPSPNEAERTF